VLDVTRGKRSLDFARDDEKGRLSVLISLLTTSSAWRGR